METENVTFKALHRDRKEQNGQVGIRGGGDTTPRIVVLHPEEIVEACPEGQRRKQSDAEEPLGG